MLLLGEIYEIFTDYIFVGENLSSFRIQSVKLTYHLGLSIQQETKKQRQNICYEKGTGLTLAVSREDGEFIPEGLILKVMLAGETFNSSLLDGFSKHFSISFLVFSESKLISENLSSL